MVAAVRAASEAGSILDTDQGEQAGHNTPAFLCALVVRAVSVLYFEQRSGDVPQPLQIMTTSIATQEQTTFKPGQILSCSWGYSMTIVDFYVVIRRTAKTVWIQEICDTRSDDNGLGNGKAMPDMELTPAKGTGLKRFKIQSSTGLYDQAGTESIWDNKTQRSIRIWDMKPQYINTYD